MTEYRTELTRGNNFISPLPIKVSGTNILTIDVEEWFHTCQSFRKEYNSPAGWDDLESRLLPQCDRLLHLFSKHRATATFFVLGWMAEKYPDLVRAIKSAGHEIASHGCNHLRVDTQSPPDFRRDVRRSKRILEEITGQPILGYRAPCFSITEKSTWALKVLREEGFLYDSSIHPLTYGAIPKDSGKFLPHQIAPDFREFPVGRMRIGGFSIPLLGGGYLRILPTSLTNYLIRRRNAEDQPVIVYLHPSDLDPSAPRIKTNLQHSLKRRIMRGRAAEKRLESLLSRFRFRTINEVYNICPDR